jgi:exopolyphosphatase/guanosine-5'-triphosphate,3'-diphosphate pyrophosphatase
VSAELEEAVQHFSRANWDEAFGSSGTVAAVAEILRAEGWTDGTITAEGLLRLKQAIVAAGEVRRLKFAGMKADRQEVLAGGVAVLAAVFDTLGLTEMSPARGALRVGVLYDLLGRRESRDLRDATVERLQERFGVDRAQARRVTQLALQLHAALDPDAPEEMVKRLGWAAALHEVGFAISHSDYHKHGAYLARHSDLAGFSTFDQEHIADLILGQRGNLKKLGTALDDPARRAKVLALRLAVVVCHARRDVALPRWSLRAARGSIELGIARDWLDHHPLTAHLLEDESEHWQRVGVSFAVRPL